MRLSDMLASRLGGLLGVLFVVFGATLTQAQTISDEKLTAALQGLDELARKTIETGGVPGLAIAVVYDDRVVHLKGFGRREAGKPDLVDSDTVFQLASLSKPVSATVVAALVSEGVVGWDTRISGLDPSFRLHDAYPTAEVTVRDLFNPRSGLPGQAGNELEEIGYDQAEILRRMRLVAPSSSFRAGYSYSNFGLTEGAVAAARPTGKSWDVVADEKLYQPLGMAATSRAMPTSSSEATAPRCMSSWTEPGWPRSSGIPTRSRRPAASARMRAIWRNGSAWSSTTVSMTARC